MQLLAKSAKVVRMIDATDDWERQVKAAAREAARHLAEIRGLSTDLICAAMCPPDNQTWKPVSKSQIYAEYPATTNSARATSAEASEQRRTRFELLE